MSHEGPGTIYLTTVTPFPSVIDDINSAFRRAAQEGRDFSIPNTNETLCARPWTLKGKVNYSFHCHLG